MTFEWRDVVVVPFPFTDRQSAKRRPALTVFPASFNRTHDYAILAVITSARSDWPSDVGIQGWCDAGLNVPCKVRLRLFTLDVTLIVRKIGTLPKPEGEALDGALGRHLVGCG